MSDSQLSNQSFFQYIDRNEVVHCFVLHDTSATLFQTQVIDYAIINTTLKLAQPISYGLTLLTLTAFNRIKFDV